MIDCQQAFALLQEILDKEASQVDEEQVRAHLQKCKHCFEKFRIEESVQAFLNEKIKVSASSDCKSDKLESMRMNLMSQLDSIDAECATSKKSSFGSPMRILLSIAALIVIGGIGLLTTEFFHHNRYYVPFEQAHWNATEQASQLSLASQKENCLNEIKEKYNYDMQTSFANYTYIGGDDEKILGVDFEHAIFANNDNYISVFITNSDNIQIPKDLVSTKISKNGIDFYDHNCPGCRLVYHKVGSLLIITASKSKDIELTDFVTGHLII